MQLRSYQQEAVEKTLEFLKSNQGNPLIVAPTGSGKSLIIAALCKELGGKNILVLAHRKELLTQNATAIKILNPQSSIDFYSASLRRKSLSSDITIAGIASIARVNPSLLPQLEYIIIDEAHLVNDVDEGQYRRLIKSFPSARVIGLSATPFRLKSGFLHKNPSSVFTDIAFDISLINLIEQGYLSFLSSKSSIVQADMRNVHVRGGEFVPEECEKIFSNQELIEKAVEDIFLHSKGRKSWLVFCSGVNHAKKITFELQKRNVSSAIITGETSQSDRDYLLEMHRRREIQALINVDVLTVGFDGPYIDLIILLRATKSCGLYIQIVGRGARIYPEKKNCMVLDYGGNIERFGPIDHITLRQTSDNKVVVEDYDFKICPHCRECVKLSLKECSCCGYDFQVTGSERTLKHGVVASELDIIKGKMLKSRFDGVQILNVYNYDFILVPKENKPTAIRIDYYLTEKDFVSEHICPEHHGDAKDRFFDWWNENTRKEEVKDDIPDTAEELLRDYKDKLRLPDRVKVELWGVYPVITERLYCD